MSDSLPDAVRLWRIMSPVKERNLLPVKILRHRLIRRQHKIFDHFCGNIPVISTDLDRNPLFVKNNLRLREIEVDGSAFSLFSRKTPESTAICSNIGTSSAHVSPQLPVMILQDLFHFRCTTYSPVNANHRFHDFMGKNGSFFVNLHEHTHCQPVFSRI